jgi:L-ascorbate metabolism protein UlaG (beta-lactamase superfamily)
MKTGLLSLILLLTLSATNAQRATPDELQTSAGTVTIQPVMHASLVLTTGGKTIYVDPSGGDGLFSGLAPADFILITDIHGDHYDSATFAALRKPTTIAIVPQVVADKIANKSNLLVIGNGQTDVIDGGISISAIPMYNIPESPTAMHTRGRGNGYVLTIGGKKIYISGDTQGIPEMRALKGIDVAFVCMNLPYTMDVPEAADAVLAFKPAVVYPYHYRGKGGFSDVNKFKELVEKKSKKIEVRLRNWYPGKDL